MQVKIAELRDEATDIRSYVLEPVEGNKLLAFTAGSHVDVFIGPGLIRQYSICSPPSEATCYRIGIQKDPCSMGGSEAIFRDFARGQIIEISEPRNHFELKECGAEFTLIGGGIGITPILAMAQRLAEIGKPFRLFYLVRSADRFAFGDLLDSEALKFHVTRHDDETQGLPKLDELIGDHSTGRQVYCCGPGPLMDAVKETCRAWPPMTVHFEHFSREEIEHGADIPFEIQLGRDGPVISVGANQSALDALQERGVEVETQCTQGLCGTCEQAVLEGRVDHRDLVLDDDEKAEHSCMMVCVSRALSKRIVLDVTDPETTLEI